MFERFTERARRVIILAREEAGRFRHDFVGTEHILLGLIRDGEGIATAVLQRLGLARDAEWLTAEGDLRTLPCHLGDPDSRMGGLDGFYAARLQRI